MLCPPPFGICTESPALDASNLTHGGAKMSQDQPFREMSRETAESVAATPPAVANPLPWLIRNLIRKQASAGKPRENTAARPERPSI